MESVEDDALVVDDVEAFPASGVSFAQPPVALRQAPASTRESWNDRFMRILPNGCVDARPASVEGRGAASAAEAFDAGRAARVPRRLRNCQSIANPSGGRDFIARGGAMPPNLSPTRRPHSGNSRRRRSVHKEISTRNLLSCPRSHYHSCARPCGVASQAVDFTVLPLRGVAMLRISYSRAAAALVLAWSLLGARGAVAQEALFEDDYAALDAAFGEPSESINVEKGALVAKLDANKWWFPFYQNNVYENADIRVKVQIPDLSAENGAGIGVTFWGQDGENLYILEIGDSGNFAVRRFAPNRYLFPVSWKPSDAIKTEPGAWNELRVVTVGNRATIYINGKEQATIKGHPPEGGSLVGLFFETGEAAKDEGRFSAFKVLEPTDTGAPAADEDAGALYADDFATLNGGWGAEAGNFGVRDGKLFVVTEPGMSSTRFWEGDVFSGDFDVSVKCHIDQKNAEEFPTGGFAFWAAGWDDHYTFQIYNDGTVSVCRWLKTRWLYPMKNKAIPAEAKFDPKGMTELRIVTQGKKATLYINGVSVGTISGQPPADGSYLGTYSESAASGSVLEYDDFVVKQK